MEVIKLTDENSEKVLAEGEKILRQGGLIIFPTDTVYGILGDATNAEAIKDIFSLKQRSPEKAFPIFVKNVAEARKYAYISDDKAKLLEKTWPGPVTFVFHHKEKLPEILTGGKVPRPSGPGSRPTEVGLGNTLGLRMPNHLLLLELLARLEFPLAQTSANISDQPPAKNLAEILSYFENAEHRPDLVIDGGEISGATSTVIDFTGNEPRILRIGLVSKEELDRLFSSLR